MDLEDLYLATYAPGAFDDAEADDVYDVANTLGAAYGPVLRDDVLDRYSAHSAGAAAGAFDLLDQDVAARSEQAFNRIAERTGLPRADVDSAVADAVEGRPLMLDRMLADYYGR